MLKESKSKPQSSQGAKAQSTKKSSAQSSQRAEIAAVKAPVAKPKAKSVTAKPAAHARTDELPGIGVDALEGVMSALDGSNVREITVTKGDAFVMIKRGAAPAAAPVTEKPSVTIPPTAAEKERRTDASPKDAKSLEGSIDVTSPAVGIFLRAKDAQADPFVKLRDNINEGDVVAMIRYMGLNHDIKSRVSGKLVEILVEDGQAVVYGQPLFRLK